MKFVKIAGVMVAAIIVMVLVQHLFFRPGTTQVAPGMQRGMANVVAATVKEETFRSQIEAVGTAHANESVDITATVSERIAAIHFENGDRVDAGDVLVQLENAEEIANAEEARISLAAQRRELDRTRTLREKNMISQQDLDNAESAADTATARLAAAEARLMERSIRAPFPGVLGLRLVSQGALVTPGTIITTLDDINVIKARFSVPEILLADLGAGQLIEAASAAWPGERFAGTVTGIDSRVNAATRAITIEAQIPNRNLKLRPGMLLTVTLISRSRASVAVSEAALTAYGARQYVFVIQPDNTVTQREVQIGERDYGRVEVVKGLAAGETIVVEGTMDLKDGGIVRVVNAPGAKDESPSAAPSTL